MNNINYNQKRHIELLKRKENFRSQNKSFFKEAPQERLELASLIQAFLNKEMNGKEFHDSVFGLRRKHQAKCDKFLSELVLEKEELKDFYPNKKSNKLKGFLSSLYFECENFE